ncbi:MAG: NADH-quinone oxidoreductase subunit I [Planctomycetota bacterium]
MSWTETDVVNVDKPELTPGQAFYLPEVFKGLGTTFKHLLGSVGGSARPTNRAMEYPEQRREDRDLMDGGIQVENFRGVHRLNRDEDGRVKCVACFMCSTACPARCIHIEGKESPWDDREKYPVKFDIDELRCIFCGMCEEACPVDAIELTQAYDIVGMSRNEMVFDKAKLLSVYDATVEGKPM